MGSREDAPCAPAECGRPLAPISYLSRQCYDNTRFGEKRFRTGQN